jgi:LysR family transcriptional regulator, nitrogen assimilation regulatory protein
MRQRRSKNKYRFNMQVSARPMAAFGTVCTSGNAAKMAKIDTNGLVCLAQFTPTCFLGLLRLYHRVAERSGVINHIYARFGQDSMQFRQLRYFVKIVEAGSFSRAASTVHIAQPALSQQIAELEERLGVALLQRSARGVRPTAAGEIFYREASAILRQLDQLPATVRSDPDQPEGVVNLGFVSSLAPGLVGFLDECRDAFPKVVIRVSDGDSLSLENKIASSSVDLAVLYEDAFTTALTRKPLFMQRLFVVSRQPMTADGGPISLERVAELPLVLPGKVNGRRAMIERVFAEAKLKPNVVLEADSLVSEMWSVRNDVGCTILPVGDLSNFGPRAFAKPAVIVPPIYFTCSIVHSADLPLTAAGEAIRDALAKFIERQLSESSIVGAERLREH